LSAKRMKGMGYLSQSQMLTGPKAKVQFGVTVPTFEDKVAQRAIVMVLESVYEQDILPCLFGFRPGRSADQALQSLHTAIWAKDCGGCLAQPSSSAACTLTRTFDRSLTRVTRAGGELFLGTCWPTTVAERQSHGTSC
jgi:hypothetical protein